MAVAAALTVMHALIHLFLVYQTPGPEGDLEYLPDAFRSQPVLSFKLDMASRFYPLQASRQTELAADAFLGVMTLASYLIDSLNYSKSFNQEP